MKINIVSRVSDRGFTNSVLTNTHNESIKVTESSSFDGGVLLSIDDKCIYLNPEETKSLIKLMTGFISEEGESK